VPVNVNISDPLLVDYSESKLKQWNSEVRFQEAMIAHSCRNAIKSRRPG
jgi:hypothetical protein